MRCLFVAAVALLSTPALAQTATPPTPTATEPAKPKQFCRRETETGSIIGSKKICHSKQEWQAIDRLNAMNTDMSPARPGNGRAGT